MQEENTISELFTTGGHFDEQKIVLALKPLITISPDNYNVYFLEEGMKNDDKILAFVLSKKLLCFKKLVPESYVSAAEVCKKTGMAKGSVDTSFNSLKGKYLLGSGKKYEIPDRKVFQVIERLDNLKKVDSK